MIFLNCIKEDLVQVNDKTRFDFSKSFTSGETINSITVVPDEGVNPIQIHSQNQEKWFLDWAYDTPGLKTVVVEASHAQVTISQNFTINVVSVEEDNLYSNDAQLFAIESELKRYIPQGRNSFINIHREAQSRILNYLDRKRIWQDNGDPYTKTQINLHGELQKWSLYETMLMIYTDLLISVGDKFAEKVNEYKTLRNYERDRGAIRIDKNNSGTIDAASEIQELKSFRLIKR